MKIEVEQITRKVNVNVVTQNVTVKKATQVVEVNQVGRRGLPGPKGDKGDPGDPATNLVQSVNGKQGVVVLNSVDVGADAAGAAAQALSDAKDYTDIAVSNIDTGVLSVQAGSNVTIDNTDPKNPIVSSTGGGGVSEWGDIGGTLSDQTDLQNALNAKADTSSLGSAAYGDVVQGLGVSTTDVISQDAFTTALGQAVSTVNNILLNKVDKVTGKGLSTNDYTDTDRDKLAGIEEGAQVNTVNSVNTQTGTVMLDADDIDDTSTTHKFATSTQLNNADSAIQPGDNISELTNDSGFTSNTGTVTSVGITGTDGIEVDSGSPITTSGSIQLGLSAAVQGQLSDASTAVQPAQIADFETTTELNARDTANRSRANHTGTQAISTVSGLQDALNAKLDSSTVTAYGMGVAVHGTNASLTRPTGFAQVTWIGTVEPDNATTNDIWYNG